MAIMAIFMVMYMMDPGGLGEMDMTHQKRASVTAGVLGTLAAVGIALLVDWTPTGTVTGPVEQTRLLGIEIMERSMLIFETAGVTILTAMIAATAIAVEGKRER
jgi:NADH:ubiquinone oxidoreductase subunit 6 (subunit J)